MKRVILESPYAGGADNLVQTLINERMIVKEKIGRAFLPLKTK